MEFVIPVGAGELSAMDEPKRFEPQYVFRDTNPNCFQFWNHSEDSELICPRCAKTPWEREFPVYADEMPEPWRCDRCDRRLTPRQSWWRRVTFRFRLFREFDNSPLIAFKKAIAGGKQYVSPQRF